MPPLRPPLPMLALRIRPSLPSPNRPSSSVVAPTRPLSTTTPLLSTNSDSQYDPPTGNLFGVKPGEKYQKEGWEGIWWVYWGALGLGAVAYGFKPDTSIQTWALEEARRRLEKEGILEDRDGETS